MKEDVSVCVCGVQRCPGAEEDVSELVCEGVFKHTADGWLLAYDEPSHAHAPRRGAQRDDLRGGRVPYHIL